MSTANVTRRLRAEGLPVELVRGEGYHYFVYDDGRHFADESVMVPRFRDLPFETWLKDGRAFAAREAVKAAEAAREPSHFDGEGRLRVKLSKGA